jgi:hypothetical protein
MTETMLTTKETIVTIKIELHITCCARSFFPLPSLVDIIVDAPLEIIAPKARLIITIGIDAEKTESPASPIPLPIIILSKIPNINSEIKQARSLVQGSWLVKHKFQTASTN